LSKKLWRALRRQRRAKQEQELERLLVSGGGLSALRRLEQKHKGEERILNIRASDGALHHDQACIGEVFALFYESLYKVLDVAEEPPAETHCEEYVTEEEVRAALHKLKHCRTGADDGLVAEMLKTGHAKLVSSIAAFFSYLLQGSLEPLVAWKVAEIKVLFKKGDPSLPCNYRPIAVLPVMAKLFSTVLYNRIAVDIDANLSPEQFGFRPNRGCADAVHVVRMVGEKSLEWGEDLWVATLDVEKAFDTVHHSSVFEGLITSGIPMSMVAVLRRLYYGVKGLPTADFSVSAEVSSKVIHYLQCCSIWF
jgi:hypothetical protein